MKAVNLIPADARRDKSGFSVGTVGPGHLLVAILAVVVILVLLRVLASNTVSNRRATLAILNQRVAAEQVEAGRLSVYIRFVQAAQQRESAVKAIAEARFPFKRTLDQIARLLPPTTSLSGLNATTTGGTSGTAGSGSVPSFAFTGCDHTHDQNGVATLLRRLHRLTGQTSVQFKSSQRQKGCGDQFNVTVLFRALPGSAAALSSPSTSATSPGTATTTTTAAPTTTTTTGAVG